MKIVLVGEGEELEKLQTVVNESLVSLGLLDVVEISSINDPAYKMELGITANPALCIEESTIDFKDMIFEGVVPDKQELVSMFASILGSSEEEGGGCGSGGCGSCSSAGGCGSNSSESSCSTHKHSGGCADGHCH